MTLTAPDVLLAMYAGMLRVRSFEERVRELFAGGRIPGFLHVPIPFSPPLEAFAAPRPDDVVAAVRQVLK